MTNKSNLQIIRYSSNPLGRVSSLEIKKDSKAFFIKRTGCSCCSPWDFSEDGLTNEDKKTLLDIKNKLNKNKNITKYTMQDISKILYLKY